MPQSNTPALKEPTLSEQYVRNQKDINPVDGQPGAVDGLSTLRVLHT